MTPSRSNIRLTEGERYFSQNLRERRVEQGLSQDALAELMQEQGFEGFNQMTVSRLEKGTRPVRLSEARALAFLLQTSTEQMSMPTEEVSAINDVFAAADAIETLYASVADLKIDAVNQRAVGQDALRRFDEFIGSDQLILPPRTRHKLSESRRIIQEFVDGGHHEFVREVDRHVSEHFGFRESGDGEH
ncbi:helix-turn-helix transcriptional regulator [Nesterenkonia sp. Act20]|uniref:helix-turn-helix transcriptional regulator n=1 Tax=Nesterenkonia sp. Act20 TaxID=1483432 RepID=UPI001C44D69F|nr:helix-turn-helix transcriptional regulator [Nesterenkonia sp. Act20]